MNFHFINELFWCKSGINRKYIKDKMTENAIRRGGCRLCLAPDSECVPIFATAAADKEPLSSKIQACVNIKVSFEHFSKVKIIEKKYRNRRSVGEFKSHPIY